LQQPSHVLAQVNLLSNDLLCMIDGAVNQPAHSEHATDNGADIGQEVQERRLLLLDPDL